VGRKLHYCVLLMRFPSDLFFLMLYGCKSSLFSLASSSLAFMVSTSTDSYHSLPITVLGLWFDDLDYKFGRLIWVDSNYFLVLFFK
jgi:hypothetical protein